MADTFSPEELNLIQRLGNAPQPSLRPERLEAIRLQLLEAMDLPPLPPANPIIPPAVVLIVVIVALAVGLIIGIVLGRGGQPSATLPPLPSVEIIITAEATETLVPTVTATDLPTETAIPITPTNQLPTETATIQASPTVMATNPASATPESTPAVGVIVIEGPIDEIRANIIIIFEIEIVVDPSNPVLAVLEPGDFIRVEGSPGTNGVIAVIVTVIDEDVSVNPDTGENWRDDGSCSNPPPDWAPANGWRRRCEGNQPNNGNGNGNGNGGNNPNPGMGMGNDD